MTDKHTIRPRASLMRIQPQPQLRQMQTAFGEFEFQNRHGLTLVGNPEGVNPGRLGGVRLRLIHSEKRQPFDDQMPDYENVLTD